MSVNETKQTEKFNKIIKQLECYSIETIINYDVKEEWFRILYGGGNNLTAWQKLCLYRLSSVGVDCDVSLRSIIIYVLAFPHIAEMKGKISLQDKSSYKYRIELPEHLELTAEYRGDTMNSYATTVNGYLRLFGDDFDKPKILNIKKNGKEFEADPDYKKWEECILDNYEYFEDRFPESGMKFTKMYHTLGNFIPVPFQSGKASFNVPRGSVTGKTRDYWDLALLNIYRWYKDNNDSHLENIVGANENRDLTKEWLMKFQNSDRKFSWNKFIEDNYLQDFVIETDSNGVYGKPKELWDDHFDEPWKLPACEEEFEQFFTRSKKWIEARGSRIAKAVKAGLKDEARMKKLESMFEQ